MTFYDLDEDNSIFEPLKIKVGGLELVVPDIDKKKFDKISDLTDPYEQLAQLAAVDMKVVEKLTMRRVAAVLKIINREFLGPAVGHFQPKKV